MDDKSKVDLININNHYFIDSPKEAISYDFEEEFFIYNADEEKLYMSKSVQTECNELEDIKNENNKLKQEINKLKIENSTLTSELSEIAKLVAKLAKVSDNNLDIDKIKHNLALFVNREIRMHKPIPFISESLFNYKKKTGTIL